MKIIGVYLNNWIRTGGQRRYLELLDSLAQKGHEVHVLMHAGLDYKSVNFQRINIPLGSQPPKFTTYSFWYKNAVRDYWKTIRPAIEGAHWLHIHGETNWPAAMYIKKRLGSAKMFFAFRSNTTERNKIVAEAMKHGILMRIKKTLINAKYRMVERSVAASSDVIAFQSEVDEQAFLKDAPRGRGKTVIIPGAIDGPRFKSEYENSNSSRICRRLIYVGLVDDSKGIAYLLKALGQMSSDIISMLHLDVLGRGQRQKNMEELCEELGISQHVTFHGQVSDPFAYIRDADLMVYPSLYDAFPDVVLEALHVGTPVLASRIGGIPDILKYDELLFPVMDSDAIATTIIRCVEADSHYMHLKNLCEQRKPLFQFNWTDAWESAMLKYSNG